MGFVRTAIVRTHAGSQFLCGQQAICGHHRAFPLDPRGRDRSQPWTFAGEPTRHHPDPTTWLFTVTIMRSEPQTNGLTRVPGGMVPDEQQGTLAQGHRFVTAPRQQLGCERTAGLPRGKAEPELLGGEGGCTQHKPITGHGFGIGVLWGQRLLDKPQHSRGSSPPVPGGPRQAAPPDFIGNAEGPVRVACREADESSTRGFCRVYAGSGLVIQCWARFQRTSRQARGRFASLHLPRNRILCSGRAGAQKAF
jgi:hypothetical protein